MAELAGSAFAAGRKVIEMVENAKECAEEAKEVAERCVQQKVETIMLLPVALQVSSVCCVTCFSFGRGNTRVASRT